MRLTLEEHPEALKRYAHVRRVRGPAARRCAAKCPGSPRTCTRERGHRGPHVAHARWRRVVAVWDSGSIEGAPAPSSRPPATTRGGGGVGRRPVGLPTRAPTGFLEALWSRVRTVVSSAEELAFLIFFVAFVVFAIQWLLLIAG